MLQKFQLINNKLFRILLDGSLIEEQDQTDWDRVRSLTEEEIIQNAENDSDAQPLTKEQLKSAKKSNRKL